MAKVIGSPERLESFLNKQSREELDQRTVYVAQGETLHAFDPAVDKDLEDRRDFSGMEFGEQLFSDALSAIKLHLLGKLMADGKISKGLIVDIQGFGHFYNKAFFLNEPRYAMEVVLRNMHHLMAGHAVKSSNANRDLSVYADQVFAEERKEEFGWQGVIAEILKVIIVEIEKDSNKTVDPGPNQRGIRTAMRSFTDFYSDKELTAIFMPKKSVLLAMQKSISSAKERHK